MTRYEKIAILLGELGGASDGILDRLNLSPEELSKIRKAMSSIRNYGEKAYNPYDSVQVKRELEVLEKLKEFGEMRGIYREVPHTGLIKTTEESVQNNVKEMVSQNPEALAKVLEHWLSED